jgi:acetolactate synthase-1/2/3 large subunit
MKLSNYVMDFIAKLGVKHVFFLPGGAAMHLNDSLARQPGIQAVCNLHEQAAAIAAEAYAKVSEGFGVAMVTAGPGSTNAVTGVASAYLDSIPCIFLSGQVKSADLKRNSGLRQLGVQEIDIVSIVGSITKYAVTIDDPLKVRYHLERGVYEATHGRQGPVWFDFPLDVQAVNIDPGKLPGFVRPAEPDSADQLRREVSRFIEMLNASERPVLVAGNGIRLAGAAPLFMEFAELLQVPVSATWLAFDLIPSDHPLCMGRPGAIAPRWANLCLQNSDLMLSLGARLDMAMTGYSHANLARGARKIVVDIDRAEIAKFQARIELPVVADARRFIAEVLRQRDSIQPVDRAAWRSRCDDWKARYPLLKEPPAVPDGVLSMYEFADALSKSLDAGDVVASGSSGFACEIFLLVVQAMKNQRIFHSRGMGAMGFGLAASIGACFASGQRRTICVDGDGGFQMNIQELATIAHHQLPIKMFVVNNRGYSSIRSSQSNYFKLCLGCDELSGLTLPDVKAVAHGYGLAAVSISNPRELPSKIREVLDSEGPMVCEVVVAPDEPRVPRLSSAQRADGAMVSRPLEDLFPFLDREEFRSNMIVAPVEE